MGQTDQTKKKMTNSDDHTPLVLNGMEKIIVVHMMLYLLFCSTYGQQNPKNGKRYSKSPITIFLHYMMDSKNI